MSWIRKYWSSFEQLSFLFVASLGASALRSLIPIFLTRMLTPEFFGLQVISVNLVSFFKDIFEVRISEVTQRHLVQCRTAGDWAGFRRGLTQSLRWDVFCSTALFALIVSGLFAASFFYQPDQRLIYRLAYIYAAVVLAGTGSSLWPTALQALEQFSWLAKLQLINTLLLVACVLGGAYGFGLPGLMWGYVAASFGANVLGLAVFRWVTCRVAGYRTSADPRILLRWEEAYPFMLHSFLSTAAKAGWGRMDTLILGYFLPVPQVGYYKIGRDMAQYISMANQSLSTLFYPKLHAAWARAEVGRYKSLLLKMSLLNAPVLPVVVFLWAMAPALFGLFFPSEYAAGIGPFRFFLVGTIAFQLLTPWARLAAFSVGKPQYSTYPNLWVMACVLALGIPAAGRWGIHGMSAVMCFSYISSSLMILWLTLAAVRGRMERPIAQPAAGL